MSSLHFSQLEGRHFPSRQQRAARLATVPGLAKSVLLFVGEPTESGHQRPAWRMGVDMAKTLLRDLRRLGLRQVEVWCERIAV